MPTPTTPSRASNDSPADVVAGGIAFSTEITEHGGSVRLTCEGCYGRWFIGGDYLFKRAAALREIDRRVNMHDELVAALASIRDERDRIANGGAPAYLEEYEAFDDWAADTCSAALAKAVAP